MTRKSRKKISPSQITDIRVPSWLMNTIHLDSSGQIETREDIEAQNFTWLMNQGIVLPKISRLVIAKVVKKLNENRASHNMIRLYAGLTSNDSESLRIALHKIGGTEDILSGEDSEKLRAFREEVKVILTYSPEHPGSIEKLLEQDDFDAIAESNLNWLIEHHFDKTCPIAQEFLDKLIAHINTMRKDERKINLATDFLHLEDQKDLLYALQTLGGTDDIFDEKNGKKLRAFQQYIEQSLRYERNHPDSIESILEKKDSTMMRYLSHLSKNQS